jgi:tRNA wybutosine-synthesizing protein 1
MHIKLENQVPSVVVQALKKHKYHIVGNHSAVKRCKWLYESIVNNRTCYKQKFYGIRSHQCLQMSPSLFYCTQQCLFCWRAQNTDLKVTWNEMKLPNWDAPESIVKGSVKAQERILSGYKEHPKADMRKLREAMTPRHIAISLTGEPTLYAPLGDLIHEFHEKGFTTFLVTNGTQPAKLSELSEEPTQLYVSVCAPNSEVFRRVCRPQMPEAWERLNETLGLLRSFRCPTVIRTTLVKGYNMENVDEYAKLIEKAQPTYVEAKAYMHIGFSTLRLGFERMPQHKEVCDFAVRLAEKTGYRILDESTDSRVVLLSKLEKPIRFRP